MGQLTRKRMTDDQFWRIVGTATVLVTIGAFRPQIMRWWRGLGYRNEGEVDTTSWRRGAAIAGGILGAFVLLLILGSLF